VVALAAAAAVAYEAMTAAPELGSRRDQAAAVTGECMDDVAVLAAERVQQKSVMLSHLGAWPSATSSVYYSSATTHGTRESGGSWRRHREAHVQTWPSRRQLR